MSPIFGSTWLCLALWFTNKNGGVLYGAAAVLRVVFLAADVRHQLQAGDAGFVFDDWRVARRSPSALHPTVDLLRCHIEAAGQLGLRGRIEPLYGLLDRGHARS